MINQYIDHTILKQTTTLKDVYQTCDEAHAHSFKAVCIPPYYAAAAKDYLIDKKSEVKVATVIGFPFSYTTMHTKISEIQDILFYVDELDIVQNVGLVKSGDWRLVEKEMNLMVNFIKNYCKNTSFQQPKPIIKIILESGSLTDEEIIRCCKIYSGIDGVDFIKTSTGFAEQGATIHHVRLIKENIPEVMGIKASGGIRTYKFAKELIDAGATRLGCSAGIKIMEEYQKGILVDEVTNKY